MFSSLIIFIPIHRVPDHSMVLLLREQQEQNRMVSQETVQKSAGKPSQSLDVSQCIS